MSSFARVVREVPLIVGGESVVRDAGVAAAETEARRQALLEEARAWREIARRVEVRGLRASGLCYEIRLACGWAHSRSPVETAAFVSTKVGDAMEIRLRAHLGGDSYIDSARDDGDYAGLRILAALFLALECEDQVRELRPARRAHSECEDEAQALKPAKRRRQS